MRREPAANTRLRGELSQLTAHGARGPQPPASRTVDDSEQRSDRELAAVLAPAAQVLKPPSSIPASRRLSPFPCRIRSDPRAPGRHPSRSAPMPRRSAPRAPKHRDHRPDAQAVAVLASLAHHRDALLGPRRIRRVAHSVDLRRAPRAMPRKRDRRAPSTGGIDQNRVSHELLLSEAILGPARDHAMDGPPHSPSRPATSCSHRQARLSPRRLSAVFPSLRLAWLGWRSETFVKPPVP